MTSLPPTLGKTVNIKIVTCSFSWFFWEIQQRKKNCGKSIQLLASYNTHRKNSLQQYNIVVGIYLYNFKFLLNITVKNCLLYLGIFKNCLKMFLFDIRLTPSSSVFSLVAYNNVLNLFSVHYCSFFTLLVSFYPSAFLLIDLFDVCQCFFFSIQHNILLCLCCTFLIVMISILKLFWSSKWQKTE